MKYLIGGLIAIVFIGFFLISPLIAYNTRSEASFTVNDKAVVVSGTDKSTSSKYLIYTTDGVYEDTDSIWYWKWNSSDVYNDLQKGGTYSATVYGFRIPFLSWYKNIVRVQKV